MSPNARHAQNAGSGSADCAPLAAFFAAPPGLAWPPVVRGGRTQSGPKLRDPTRFAI